MIRKLIYSLVLAAITSPLLAQGKWQFTLQKSITTPSPVVSASVDRPGELYLLCRDGQILHTDQNGDIITQVTTPLPDVFDPRDGARHFVFFRKNKTAGYISPALDMSQAEPLEAAFAIQPEWVCASGDYNLIILDGADTTLKKIDVKKGLVLWEKPVASSLKKKLSILAMREYQNFIFIQDKTQGVLVFNALGKLIKTIPVKASSNFGFLGEEMYYRDGDRLLFFDLFKPEGRDMKLPCAQGQVLLTDQRIFCIQDNKVDYYTYAPLD